MSWLLPAVVFVATVVIVNRVDAIYRELKEIRELVELLPEDQADTEQKWKESQYQKSLADLVAKIWEQLEEIKSGQKTPEKP